MERAVASPEPGNKSLEENDSEYTNFHFASENDEEVEEAAAPSPLAVRISQPRSRTPTQPAKHRTRTNRAPQT